MPMVFPGGDGIQRCWPVVLDGYDLGVGVLMMRADDDKDESMIASISLLGHETWLVLGVEHLAHRVSTGAWRDPGLALPLPVAMMLI
jgi:cytochrome d ubiquinol oxidase subunit II